MITLTIHEGRPAVEVEGKGKPALYRFRRNGNKVQLARVDDLTRASTVSKTFPSRWCCSCKGFQFSKKTPHVCKHVMIAQELLPLLDAMSSETALA